MKVEKSQTIGHIVLTNSSNICRQKENNTYMHVYENSLKLNKSQEKINKNSQDAYEDGMVQ